ncbi:MAG: type II secretion system F family protein [Deltaproteobacteria bacterium]|nr:type II secretion system F family protein [Deltaproteobacteria bacterium]
MREYEYEIIDRDDRVVKGRAKAASVNELVRGLNAEGHTVVEVKEPRAARPSPFRRRPGVQDRIVALHELATLLESGVSLGNAVQAQADGTRHPALTASFEAMAMALVRGESFLQALRAGHLSLPEYVYQLVEAGELNGQLATALRQAVEQMQYDQRVASEIRGALLYPAILVVSGCTAVLIVFVFVIPQFSGLLESGNELPLLAEAVLRAGLWFDANGWLLAGVSVIFAVAIAALSRSEGVRQQVRDTLSALPVLRDWFTEADTAKWASLMSAMLASRVGIMDALPLAAHSVRISRRRATLEQATGDVRGGASLSEALEKRRALTPTGYNLLRVGEQSGQLAEMLHALATLCDENGRRRMKRFLTLIEPLAVVLVGGFLGLIMIGVILAITSVNDVTF